MLGQTQARENSAFDRQNFLTATSLYYARPPNTTLTSLACQSNFIAIPTMTVKGRADLVPARPGEFGRGVYCGSS
jgi:hypothetical protein